MLKVRDAGGVIGQARGMARPTIARRPHAPSIREWSDIIEHLRGHGRDLLMRLASGEDHPAGIAGGHQDQAMVIGRGEVLAPGQLLRIGGAVVRDVHLDIAAPPEPPRDINLTNDSHIIHVGAGPGWIVSDEQRIGSAQLGKAALVQHQAFAWIEVAERLGWP